MIDRKIMGVNLGAELTIGEYHRFAPNIIDKNGFQRRKVKTAGKTYDLLRKDLLLGCVIPPIILAVTDAFANEVNFLVKEAIDRGSNFQSWDEIEQIVRRATTQNEILILDGLQRSLTIESIIAARDSTTNPNEIDEFLRMPIRVEIYVGLSKTGILYRMLTLNTGQTPMSFRHQLEILYHDYIENSQLPDGIEVFREADDRRARGGGKYKYSDVVDMFYAFSTASPMPFDKQALVGELREMNFLERYTFKENADDLQTLLVLYNRMVTKIQELSNEWMYNPDTEDDSQLVRPFGTNVPSIFARPQPMAGFGAECKRLINIGAVSAVEDFYSIIDNLRFVDDADRSLRQLLRILNEIAGKAKRIGDAQRAYFQYAFRALLLPESESYTDLSKSWLKGQESYEMMY